MAPKQKYSKQDIIVAAFEIAKFEGLDSITIRRVAKKLGSSIAPIYVNFYNVDELIQEVVKKAFEVSKQMLMDQNTGQPFRDIGITSLRFAKEYSVLYRDLIMKNNPHMKYNNINNAIVIEQMKKDPTLSGFSNEEMKMILFKMQTFQTGLSVMVAYQLFPNDFNEERIIEILDSAAADVITAARLRKNGSFE
ncbi:TetR/AcrR family transcriptional regulator [Peribacillus huizhouensis]|uniref:AcrR family transcriptional regulator n=1 Tax=Peribacillus huizhouensis TaxID=1501239 RepID=A0ABR6CN08_9BACI|nr:TetR/AcrR family transcriptional regulator [Peribacillus huizhouensis]MBA9026395.1 AcrR family transcriptional regulator [Peribacillus huizhouensis]